MSNKEVKKIRNVLADSLAHSLANYYPEGTADDYIVMAHKLADYTVENDLPKLRQLFEPKPDKSRLLVDEEIKEFISDHGWILSPARLADMISQFKEFAFIVDKRARQEEREKVLEETEEQEGESGEKAYISDR